MSDYIAVHICTKGVTLIFRIYPERYTYISQKNRDVFFSEYFSPFLVNKKIRIFCLNENIQKIFGFFFFFNFFLYIKMGKKYPEKYPDIYW